MAALKVDQAYVKAAASAREHLNTLIHQDQLAGRAFIRLAFNDALTYDKLTNTGGPNGSIRTRKELERPGNAGLSGVVELIKGLQAKYPALSHADLIQLAAVAAVAAAGGPEVHIALGRADSWSYPPPGRLPDPRASEDPVAHLRALASRLGLALKQLIALAGVHPLCGRWWPGDELPANPQGSPARFSNAYFRDVLEGKTDPWLLKDAETSHLVAEFAADEGVFAKEYVLAHEALSCLGTRLMAQGRSDSGGLSANGAGLLSEEQWALAQVAAAVVIGAAVAAGLYWRRRRRLLRH
ncbi:hypothetical protein WJX81_003468 [Elliptochloris bilobata]|uniref:Plant heme peroxidase family profile domain-containing protein n=1 Tax=Elliptochloris bilobata TaxID=381761 RepID=A0AAW1RYL4_9CHLO